MSEWRIINRKVIEGLKPCQPSLDNYLKHYADFEGDISEALQLELISDTDKVWVACRVMPRLLVEVFAVDCSLAAYADAADAYAADVYAAAAADAYAAGAGAAAAADAYAAGAGAYADARKNQVDALIMIVEGVDD